MKNNLNFVDLWMIMLTAQIKENWFFFFSCYKIWLRGLLKEGKKKYIECWKKKKKLVLGLRYKTDEFFDHGLTSLDFDPRLLREPIIHSNGLQQKA